jgi:hypothetical protein
MSEESLHVGPIFRTASHPLFSTAGGITPTPASKVGSSAFVHAPDLYLGFIPGGTNAKAERRKTDSYSRSGCRTLPRLRGNQMKTVTLYCALLLACLTATSGCANRRPMCRNYNCCPQAPSYCPSPCPTPCTSQGYGSGQMEYSAGYDGAIPNAPSNDGYMPSAPSDGGMMSYPTSYGETGCPNCN